MPLLDSMDSRIGDEMTVHALDKQPGVLPAVVPWLYPGYQDLQTPEGKKGAFWDRKTWVKYIKLLQDPSSVELSDLENSQANRTGAGMAKLGTLATLNEYCSPLLGRPNIHPAEYLQRINTGFGAVRQGEDLGEKQEIFQAQMENTDANLDGLHFLYFEQKRADGQSSIGWMSQTEKNKFLEALLTQKSDNLKSRLYGLWQSIKADLDDEVFNRLWNQRAQSIEKWYRKFNEIEASDEMKAFGKESSRAFPELLGIKTSLEALYEIAKADLRQIMVSIESVRAACADIEMPELGFKDNEELIERARNLLKEFGKGMDIPAQNMDTIDITVKDESQIGAAPITTSIAQSIEFYPREGQDEYWADKGGRFPWVVMHEATHVVQNCSPHLSRWDTQIGKDSNGLGSEMAHLNAAPTGLNPHHLLQQLKSAAGNAAIFVAAMEHHAGFTNSQGNTPEQVLTSAGIAAEPASRLWAEIQTNPWKWGAYWLGTKLFVQYADSDHNGNVQAAFKRSLEESDGILSPHFISKDFEYGEYEITPSTPWIVREANRRGY